MNVSNIPATAIIGLGNPLRGDDGVGVCLLPSLRKQTLPPNVKVIDGGTQGLNLVNLIEGWQRVILIDAAEIGKSPGQFIRFRLEEADLSENKQHLSIHSAGLSEALLLAQALKILPPEVIIFGVQPADIEWKTELSPAVEACIPHLIEVILSEIFRKENPNLQGL